MKNLVKSLLLALGVMPGLLAAATPERSLLRTGLAFQEGKVYLWLRSSVPVTRPNLFLRTEHTDSTVFYATYRDFAKNLWIRDTVGTYFAFELKNPKPDSVYVYRALAVDAEKYYPYLTENRRFRLLKTPEGWQEGLVVTLGPFLALPTETTMTVFWWANRPVPARVEARGPEGSRVVAEAAPGLRQEATLRSLKPGSEYRYRVVLLGEADTFATRWFRFHTLSPGRVRLAVTGDSRMSWRYPETGGRVNRVAYRVVQEVMLALYREQPDAIVFTGDLVSGYARDTAFASLQFRTWLDATWPVSARIPVLPVMGNHDAAATTVKLADAQADAALRPWLGEALWARIFTLPANGPRAPEGARPYTENVYYWDLGPVRLIVLNSDYGYAEFLRKRNEPKRRPRPRVDARQRAWLQEVTRGLRRYPIVAYHEPAYPVIPNHSLDRAPEARDSLWAALLQTPVQMVFNGHEHLFAHSVIDSTVDPRWHRPIHQFIVGRAGAPLYSPSYRGIPVPPYVQRLSPQESYALVTVDGTGVQVVVRNLAGEVLDRLTLPAEVR